PLTGSAFPIALTGATLTTPAGVTLLPNGDLLVSDTVAGLVQVNRTTSSLTFPTSTLVFTTDTVDGDLALTVENTGSYTVTVPAVGAPDISSPSFFSDTTGTCPSSASGQLQIPLGAVCQYEVGFQPKLNGLNTGTLTFSGTGGNGSVSAVVALSGTGFVILDHFTLTVSPSTVNPGQATTLTVTAFNTDNSVDTTYTGTITLSSTDATAHLPSATYTFTAADNGVHVFSSTSPNPLTFNTLGTWTVSAADAVTITGKTITGTSNVVTVVTTPAVTLTSSVNPVNVNATTLLTATVTSTFGTPTGTVTFMDGATPIGTGTLNGSGVATLNVSFSTPGPHTLTASYPGVGFFQAATSAPLIETVDDFTPAITLTSSVNPVGLGNTTQLTATLTSASGTPTGTVTFLDGTTVLGTATLSNGVATLNVSFSTVGQHTLTVSYPGNGFFQAITSAPLLEIVGDFSLTLAPSSPTSASILLGGSATYNLIVAPVGSSTLAAPVALSVLGLPDGGSASFAPATVPTGSGSTPVVMTVNAPPLITAMRRPASDSPFSHRTAPALLALLLLPIGALVRRRKPLLRLLILLVSLGAASTGLTGCLSNATTGYYGQPPATYTLIVSGTSGNLVHTVQVSLTVE
ncbi:MAG TPA: Ig-like domain-containing protein, partial [Acidobacteriaceae bacterium]